MLGVGIRRRLEAPSHQDKCAHAANSTTSAAPSRGEPGIGLSRRQDRNIGNVHGVGIVCASQLPPSFLRKASASWPFPVCETPEPVISVEQCRVAGEALEVLQPGHSALPSGMWGHLRLNGCCWCPGMSDTARAGGRFAAMKM
jgi:hypothetical protein